MFYVTLLDISCSVVLGQSWLTCYNLLIDWELGSITFWPLKEIESLVPLESATLVRLTSVSPSSVPKIALVDAVAFTFASKLADMQVFRLFIATTTPANSKTTLIEQHPC